MIYSIGYQGHTIHSFVKALKKRDVKLLVDVRSIPYSRYSENFNRDRLREHLEKAGIEYIWKGDCLGGKSGVRMPRYVECLKWLVEESEKLQRHGRTKRVCIMCMESDPAKCHRNMWIAKDLSVMFKVDTFHIRRGSEVQFGRL